MESTIVKNESMFRILAARNFILFTSFLDGYKKYDEKLKNHVIFKNRVKICMEEKLSDEITSAVNSSFYIKK